ncbi:uncharacterized protein B0I36DRAFT_340523 [Microdochium trichocladiopsis]|uniref:F-box domain-containing protein n=1 Tax=Microdochium trichocladiopsis TaxID=1682393 RepID=A0A9P8XQG4_9PEZI|nr:uncharacterized protein B0I36DRAFT_340523 [Microdochium trichocladiopsis]KAH7012099.1 hypothetical protein B0I36DRAFT_340523 [Microdochium trichocladiopsis]
MGLSRKNFDCLGSKNQSFFKRRVQSSYQKGWSHAEIVRLQFVLLGEVLPNLESMTIMGCDLVRSRRPVPSQRNPPKSREGPFTKVHTLLIHDIREEEHVSLAQLHLFPGLLRLSLRSTHLRTSTTCSLKHLRKLTIHDCSLDSNSDFTKLLQACPRLADLSVGDIFIGVSDRQALGINRVGNAIRESSPEIRQLRVDLKPRKDD